MKWLYRGEDPYRVGRQVDETRTVVYSTDTEASLNSSLVLAWFRALDLVPPLLCWTTMK